MSQDKPFPLVKWFLSSILGLTFLVTVIDFLFNMNELATFSLVDLRNVLFYLMVSVLSNLILMAIIAVVFIPLYKRYKSTLMLSLAIALPFFVVVIPYILMGIAYSRIDNAWNIVRKALSYAGISVVILLLIIVLIRLTLFARFILNKPKLIGSMQKIAMVALAGFLIFFIVLFILSPRGDTIQSKESKPNIVLIVVDALRKDFVGAYGFPLNITPYMDELANSGVLFENPFASSISSIPGHASILFGEEIEEHKAITNSHMIKEKKVSIASLLKERGYSTFGVCRNPLISTASGFGQGFDFYWSWGDRFISNAPLQYFLTILPLSQIIIRAMEIDLTTAYSKLLFKERNYPFFVFCQYLYCHTPYRDLSKPRWITKERTEKIKDLYKTGKLPDETSWPLEKTAKIASSYAASVYYMDSIIKDLIQDLSKKNLVDNTLVIITADHGENLADHGQEHAQEHEGHFNTSIQIPLIVWSPRLSFKGARVLPITSQAKIIDVVMDAISEQSLLFSSPPDMDSLVNVMCKDEHFAYGGDTFVLYDNAFKYVINVPGRDGLRNLYEWKEDYYDKKNIVHENEDIALAMQKRLANILARSDMIKTVQVKKKLTKEQERNLKALGYIQ